MTKELKEPEITINGAFLSQGQAMTVRIALENFAMSMGPQEALGADAHAKHMREAYLTRLEEIRKMMYR